MLASNLDLHPQTQWPTCGSWPRSMDGMVAEYIDRIYGVKGPIRQSRFAAHVAGYRPFRCTCPDQRLRRRQQQRPPVDGKPQTQADRHPDVWISRANNRTDFDRRVTNRL